MPDATRHPRQKKLFGFSYSCHSFHVSFGLFKPCFVNFGVAFRHILTTFVFY
nr:MAG TPA: hypothetical protein [Caudoviricetes sp.]